VEIGSEGYPLTSRSLVKGVQLGASSDRKIRSCERFRSMTGGRMGLRAVQDDPDSTSWGGKNVFELLEINGHGTGWNEIFGLVAGVRIRRKNCCSLSMKDNY